MMGDHEIMKSGNSDSELLSIQKLRVLFPIHKRWIAAVDGVDLTIKRGEIIGIVGESGSGKSVMSQSILRLREYDTAIRYEGEILFGRENVLKMSPTRMRRIRGKEIAVIFQDPMTSLSPVHTIGEQLADVIPSDLPVDPKDKSRKHAVRTRAIELLRLTGIPEPEQCILKYPHELSGGMQQRVMIALALACEPDLLIADEPTTALDVTIQEQILELLRDLNEKLGMSVLFITHDMGAVAKLCHRICVMYLGQIVEEADTRELFYHPLHPYTKGLLNCIPHLAIERGKPLPVIPGNVPPLSQIPSGCHFCTRCPYADQTCREEEPLMIAGENGHKVKCWKYRSMMEEKEGRVYE